METKQLELRLEEFEFQLYSLKFLEKYLKEIGGSAVSDIELLDSMKAIKSRFLTSMKRSTYMVASDLMNPENESVEPENPRKLMKSIPPDYAKMNGAVPTLTRQLESPTNSIVMSNGFIMVPNNKSSVVVMASPNGVKTIQSKTLVNLSTGERLEPSMTAMDYNSGEIVVNTLWNGLVVYNSSLMKAMIKLINGNAQAHNGMAIDRHGRIWMTNFILDQIIIYDRSTRKQLKYIIEGIKSPWGIGFLSNGNLVVSCTIKLIPCIVIVDKKAKISKVIGHGILMTPKGIYVDIYDNILVADEHHGSIFVFTSSGDLICKTAPGFHAFDVNMTHDGRFVAIGNGKQMAIF